MPNETVENILQRFIPDNKADSLQLPFYTYNDNDGQGDKKIYFVKTIDIEKNQKNQEVMLAMDESSFDKGGGTATVYTTAIKISTEDYIDDVKKKLQYAKAGIPPYENQNNVYVVKIGSSSGKSEELKYEREMVEKSSLKTGLAFTNDSSQLAQEKPVIAKPSKKSKKNKEEKNPFGKPIIFMKKAPGEKIEKYYQEDDGKQQVRKLSLDESIAVINQLQLALQDLHENGVIHRDVSPNNVFVLPGKNRQFLKVNFIDYGFSRSFTIDEDQNKILDKKVDPNLGTDLFVDPLLYVVADHTADVLIQADDWGAARLFLALMVGKNFLESLRPQIKTSEGQVQDLLFQRPGELPHQEDQDFEKHSLNLLSGKQPLFIKEFQRRWGGEITDDGRLKLMAREFYKVFVRLNEPVAEKRLPLQEAIEQFQDILNRFGLGSKWLHKQEPPFAHEKGFVKELAKKFEEKTSASSPDDDNDKEKSGLEDF